MSGGGEPVSIRRVLRLWSPLASSWLLMAAETPLFVAAVARLPDASTHLAAFGGVVYPLALLIESPIVMLLAASVALSRDRESHRVLSRYMWTAGIALTALHVLVAFTPLFDAIAGGLLGAPDAMLESARTGFRWLVPWTLAIAYRRFQQGVLIRCERSRIVVSGTIIRLASGALVLGWGLVDGRAAGIAVGCAAIAVGVTAEAVFTGLAVRPVLRERLPAHDPAATPPGPLAFVAFYVPLALTPLVALGVQPIAAAAMHRMPEATVSLASWAAVHSCVFLLRAPGFALQEVAVRLIGEPGGAVALARFARGLAALVTLILALLWLTPAGTVWFRDVSGLGDDLVEVASGAIVFALPLPALEVAIHHRHGVLVHGSRTRAVTVGVLAYAVTAAAGCLLAVWSQAWRGIDAALVALGCGALAQVGWLCFATRPARRV